jgi:3-phosphoshikimate 1-carboxyvinyltransferase
LTGFLAGCPFSCTLSGDESLRSRPFKRVTDPLSQMGACFDGESLPLKIRGGALKGIDYLSPKASAQVKSAILLAGLQASGPVSVVEPWRSRDHTERMLTAMGCEVRGFELENGHWKVELPGEAERRTLSPLEIEVPGDFSAAAFFLVAGTIVPDSQVLIKGVGFNPTRTGLFSILRRMGANIKTYNPRNVGGEEVIDLEVNGAALKGVDVHPEDVVLAIDEIPALAVAAAFAEGVTRISGAEELRVKESDRLKKTAELLKSFSVEVKELPDGLLISGNPALAKSFRESGQTVPDGRTSWRHSGDHRIAMCGAVLEYSLCAEFQLSDAIAVETSFPTFVDCFERLGAQA